jgi:uncharacterized protein (TIGR02757 family)
VKGASRVAVSTATRALLDEIYRALTRREHVGSDPVGFLHRCDDLLDREIVGLVAASLAYGRVKQIHSSVEDALGRLGPSPSRAAQEGGDSLASSFEGFKHRFTTGEEVAALIRSAGALQRRHGSLGARFAALLWASDETVVPALGRFVRELGGEDLCEGSSVLPIPERGSACKRLHLYLRWMVRRDEVDPGGWDGVSPSKLVAPLDTHMHRIGRALGFTGRKQADLRAALEITEALRRMDPEDPVKYDFALTRLGIHGDSDAFAAIRRKLFGASAG